MKTAEIINNACSHLGITKADLAKRLGLYPSSFYRKLANDSMTLEELQRCLDVMGASMEMEIIYPDGNTLSSQENHEQLMDRMSLLQKELEVEHKAAEYHKKLLRELRTELNSAVGYAELSRKQDTKATSYLDKLQLVHTNMERTIAHAFGEDFDDNVYDTATEDIEALVGKRVLLVDDNEMNREIMKEVLVSHGLLVDEADNGYRAIEALKDNSPGYYQFVLMDIEMPEMDGYEATMKIRKLPNRIRANVPIIALTANAVRENRERASVVGMDDFLVKPANSGRLISSLVKFL